MVKKNYKEIKPHSSEENEDNVVEGEIYNDENDEYVYYRWGATLYFSLLFIFLQAASGGLVNCPDLSRGMETQ